MLLRDVERVDIFEELEDREANEIEHLEAVYQYSEKGFRESASSRASAI
jgi:hypothetical protein